jgi:hypothetical protein
VVTLLDVLGWKGVYHRQKDPIASLNNLVDGVKRRTESASRGRILGAIEVRSISDTVAIFCVCLEKEVNDAIEIHGELCSWLIPASIGAELPMRGATAYGEFTHREGAFVGKAIDEAASWHEHSDWIGVHLTPSAELVLDQRSSLSVWQPYEAPTKTKLKWTPYCVNWTKDWVDREDEVAKIKQAFVHLGPIVPEIAGKYINTLKFVEEMDQVARSLNGIAEVSAAVVPDSHDNEPDRDREPGVKEIDT